MSSLCYVKCFTYWTLRMIKIRSVEDSDNGRLNLFIMLNYIIMLFNLYVAYCFEWYFTDDFSGLAICPLIRLLSISGTSHFAVRSETNGFRRVLWRTYCTVHPTVALSVTVVMSCTWQCSGYAIHSTMLWIFYDYIC